ncbi:MAG: hypothetical protein JW741_26390 [Sedimentisphaerales bacterium]|nr:hypothetical protein [Sedimentisphaerales bacterium]
MNVRIPDWLRYELRHKIEWLQDRYARLGVREAINDNPRIVAAVAGVSLLLLIVVLAVIRRPAPGPEYEEGREAWFYDMNTGKLFTAGRGKAGPIEAPSGPLPDGGPAGVRANVYSYVLDPNQAELFVGFLERPNPDTGSGRKVPDRSDFDEWARATSIRRIDSNEWVPATSSAAEQIMAETARPNEKGQTPIYQVPR